jgi:hypothetical protein
MPWVAAVAGAGASLIGSSMQAGAAGDAAEAQAQSAAKADATQRYMYDTTRADNAQFLGTGQGANNRLSYLLGLSSSAGPTPAAAMTRDQFRSQLLPQYTTTTGGYGNVSWGDGTIDPMAGAGVSTIDEGGLNSAIEARWRQQAQEQAQRAQAQGNALTDPAYGSLMRNFGQSDMDADPVYQSGLLFGLDEGRKGLNNQAAANGSLNSGAVLKALTRFGNDYASTKAGDSYNRNKADKASTFNMLSGVSGTGQVASNQISSAGQNMTNNVSQNQLALGNVRGASAIAQGNALSGGLTGAYNSYQQQQMMDIMRNRSGSANGYGAPGYGADRTGLGGYDAVANGGWGTE